MCVCVCVCVCVFFSISNLVKFNLIPDLKADSSCLLEGIGDITNNKFTECITDSAESMAMSMRNMTGMTNASSEVPTEAFCEYVIWLETREKGHSDICIKCHLGSACAVREG